MTWMPNPEFISENERIIKSDLKARLKYHIVNLSQSSSGRNIINEDTLTPAREYIVEQFYDLGLTASFHEYEEYGDMYSNIIIDLPAKETTTSTLIIGAHYDSVENVPGANDNASGIAALIELGRYLLTVPETNHRIRLIAFTNEEPPYFREGNMGSRLYVNNYLDSGEKIHAMISLETLGYYTNEKESQSYPKPFNYLYPDTANFIAFVGNIQSRELVSTAISIFRQHSTVPSEGLSAPAFIPGVAWSDHSSFWAAGHQALMITDTAPYRYEHYHKASDTADKINYETYSAVVSGIFNIVETIANNE